MAHVPIEHAPMSGTSRRDPLRIDKNLGSHLMVNATLLLKMRKKRCAIPKSGREIAGIFAIAKGFCLWPVLMDIFNEFDLFQNGPASIEEPSRRSIIID